MTRSILYALLILLFSSPAWAACTSPAGAAGDLLYNAAHNRLQWCDNTSWVGLPGGGAGGAGCSSPTGSAGDMVFNSVHHVLQWCDGANWIGLPKDPCAASSPPAVGTRCSDGSIYAGLDSTVPMYLAQKGSLLTNNNTCAGGSAGYWNNGMSGFTTTGATSHFNGATNTATIITIDSDTVMGGTQPHQAAQFCANLGAHGHTDWYLPARNELNVLYTNRVAINDISVAIDLSGYHWSSTELNSSFVYYQYFYDGTQSTASKNTSWNCRCVRKKAYTQCSSPTGSAGDIVYNASYNVLQWCNGDSWISFPPKEPCVLKPGLVCTDGTVSAGLSPDSSKPMYTTPTDPGQYYWKDNNNTAGSVTTGQTDLTTGSANTANLITIDSNTSIAGTQPHQAAQYCADLNAHGHTDWYLPARNEASVMINNLLPIGGYITGPSYWTSSDTTNQFTAVASQGSGSTAPFKNTLQNVRCVRK